MAKENCSIASGSDMCSIQTLSSVYPRPSISFWHWLAFLSPLFLFCLTTLNNKVIFKTIKISAKLSPKCSHDARCSIWIFLFSSSCWKHVNVNDNRIVGVSYKFNVSLSICTYCFLLHYNVLLFIAIHLMLRYDRRVFVIKTNARNGKLKNSKAL